MQAAGHAVTDLTVAQFTSPPQRTLSPGVYKGGPALDWFFFSFPFLYPIYNSASTWSFPSSSIYYRYYHSYLIRKALSIILAHPRSSIYLSITIYSITSSHHLPLAYSDFSRLFEIELPQPQIIYSSPHGVSSLVSLFEPFLDPYFEPFQTVTLNPSKSSL